MAKNTLASLFQKKHPGVLEHYPAPRSMFSDGWTSCLKKLPDQIIGWVTTEDQSHYPARMHHRYNLILNLGDPLEVQLDGLHFLLQTDQMLLVFPLQPHRFRSSSPPGLSCAKAHFTFTLPGPLEEQQFMLPLKNRIFTPDEDLRQIILRLLESCSRGHSGPSGEIPLWLAHVLERCLQNSSQADSFNEAGSLIFRRALAYIRTHYMLPIRISTVAAAIGCSASRLAAVFKKQTGGENLGSYIGRLRFCLAVEFLLNSDMRLEEIAQKCGYRDAFSFSRRFRQYEPNHMPPSVFRNTARQNGIIGWKTR